MRCIKKFAYFLAAIWFFGCSKPSSSVLAITPVTVIDATGAPARPEMTVLVDDHRIIAVGDSRSSSIPRNSRVIDGTAKFLIPGLLDSHVHLATVCSLPFKSSEPQIK